MQVVGHQKILDYFTKSLKNGSLSHAYLFVGPRGVGKKTVAAWLIGKLLDIDPSLVLPLTKGEGELHPDIAWVKREEDKKNITIEQIRNLRARLRQSAFLTPHKVAVIEEAQDMTQEAANALLKTLEEPSGQALLILTSSRARALLPTIRSRAENISFAKVPVAEILEALKSSRLTKQADELARLSYGLPQRAFALARDSKLYSSWQQSAKDLLKLLPETRAMRLAYAEGLANGKKSSQDKNYAISNLLSVWQSLVRDLILSRLGLSGKLANISFAKELKKISDKSRLEKLVTLQKSLSQALQQIRQNANPKLVLGNVLLDI